LTLLRVNGRPSAAFAAAVDDHLMAITHVIAPDRHLARVPGQIRIARAFGWQPPVFAHLPLITGPDHKPLAPRHGAATLDDLYQQGFLPEAVTAGLALLGWAPDPGDEIPQLKTMAQSFDLDRVSASPAAFDLKKLESINGRALRALAPARLAEAVAPYLRAAGLDPAKLPGERLIKAAAAVRERLTRLADAPDELRMFFQAPASPDPEDGPATEAARVAARLRELLEAAPDPGREQLDMMIKRTGRELGLRGPELYIPIRLAVSGRTRGPDLAELMEALGRDEVILRLRRASGPRSAD
jgi:glutamyl/glutaminyl-tRNA synthetase